jgi:hypothetical protein
MMPAARFRHLTGTISWAGTWSSTKLVLPAKAAVGVAEGIAAAAVGVAGAAATAEAVAVDAAAGVEVPAEVAAEAAATN